MTSQFYKIMKKRGFHETLEILGEFENNKAVQREFFEKMDTRDSYYNAYFRVKKFMIEKDIIRFELDKDYQKVVCLTDKGKRILELMHEVEHMIA